MLSFTTTFRGDDPTCLVDAALACPVCLAGGADWRLDLDPYDARAQCRCAGCGTEFELYLPPEQALRLALTPAPRARTPCPAG